MTLRTTIIEPGGFEHGKAFILDQSNPTMPTSLDRFIRQPEEARMEVMYVPGPREQRAANPNGFMGDYTVQYDVNQPNDGGDIQVIVEFGKLIEIKS